MTLLGALVVLLHLRRRNLDFLDTFFWLFTYNSNESANLYFPYVTYRS